MLVATCGDWRQGWTILRRLNTQIRNPVPGQNITVSIKDLVKLNLVNLANGGLVFSLETIFTTAQAAS